MSAITIVLLIVYLAGFGGASVFLILKSMGGGSSDQIEAGGDGFGSRIGFILSTIGMSVGVGAMWRFPMMCAQWGGGAFVLAFVIICIVLVIPAGWAEIAFGRVERESEVGALTKVAGTPGRLLGWFMSLDQVFLWGYYPAVIALVVVYFFKTFGGLSWASNAQEIFVETNDNRWLLYGVVIVILIAVALISSRGISGGIEKVCKIMLPALFIILVILAVRCMFIPGIGAGIEFYVKPDWAELANPQMWSAAAGMALFAVGLGPGCLLVYGRYVDNKQDIATDFVTVNVVQLFICIVSGFVIIPGLVAFGMDPVELGATIGKGVMFISLPQVFGTMAGGPIFMILFYVALIFAGISSSLNQMEVGMALFIDKTGGLGMTRTKAVIAEFIVAAIAAYFCTFYDSFFAVFDNIVGNIGYCVSALGMAIVCGWVVGAKKVREEWYNPTSAIKWGAWVDLLYKYLFPVVMAYFSITAIISLF